MLNPASRLLYIDALRPPEGYVLDRSVGTTFSLDLTTALTIPLSMAAFEWREEDDPHPLALLEALRRVARKVVVFCQQGQIAVPQPHNLLYSYLESTVVEVRPASGNGVFHPKVWILRFTDEEGSVLYRFLCLSRNLTFDRSWDTVLCLEGALGNRRVARNRPLTEFVQALPSLAVRPIPGLTEEIGDLTDELTRVQFEPPSGFNPDFRFWHFGIRKYRRIPIKPPYSRLLIISPWLSPGLLERLTEHGSNHVLISRSDSLDQIEPAILEKFETVYTLDEAAIEAEELQASDSPESEPDTATELSGLHAKLVIAEHGGEARIWTGSANATNAAFDHRNVEFMVELQGKKRAFGIDQLLGPDESGTSFNSLLQPYQSGLQSPVDPTKKDLENLLDEARAALSGAEMILEVLAGEAPNTYDLCLRISGTCPSLPPGVTGTCWPITLTPSQGSPVLKLISEGDIRFNTLAVVSLTSFTAFELKASEGEAVAAVRFVLNLPLIGAPIDRPERILSHIVSDRESFLRYIFLLLAEEGTLSNTLAKLIGNRSNNGSGGGVPPIWDRPLLEELVRSYSRNPEKLERIGRLVEELKQSPNGAEVIPKGFDEIWQVFAKGLRQ